jgi:aminoglycoside 2''-phosphotransferase
MLVGDPFSFVVFGILPAMQYEDIRAQICDVVDFEIKDIRLLGSGMANTAYVVNGTWVFRFATIDEAKRTLIKEIATLPVLAESLPVKIPEPVYTRIAPNQLYFGGYRLLPGEPLTRERFDGLASDIQGQLLHEFHAFMVALHAVQPTKVPALKEEPFVGAYNQAQRHFHQRLGSIIKSDDVRKIEAIFVAYEADPVNRLGGPAVIHSDLKPDHVLFDAGSGHLTGVLDWGDSALGDPDYDFTCIGMFFGRDFLNRLLDCGVPADKERVLRKVSFLSLVRGLQDLTLFVRDGDDEFIALCLQRISELLRIFADDGTLIA